MPAFNNRVLDLGLNCFTDEANGLYVCSADPALDWVVATSTFALGWKLGLVCSAPQEAIPTGRRVMIPPFSDGAWFVDGTATHYAVVDAENERVLWSGAISPTQIGAAGQALTMASPLYFTMPGALIQMTGYPIAFSPLDVMVAPPVPAPMAPPERREIRCDGVTLRAYQPAVWPMGEGAKGFTGTSVTLKKPTVPVILRTAGPNPVNVTLKAPVTPAARFGAVGLSDAERFPEYGLVVDAPLSDVFIIKAPVMSEILQWKAGQIGKTMCFETGYPLTGATALRMEVRTPEGELRTIICTRDPASIENIIWVSTADEFQTPGIYTVGIEAKFVGKLLKNNDAIQIEVVEI